MQIRDLIDAPEEQLSLHALSKDVRSPILMLLDYRLKLEWQMFQPKYTTNGLEVEDHMAANGSMHSRVLRVVLTNHLGDLEPSLANIISTAFSKEAMAARQGQHGWIQLQSFSMIRALVWYHLKISIYILRENFLSSKIDSC